MLQMRKVGQGSSASHMGLPWRLAVGWPMTGWGWDLPACVPVHPVGWGVVLAM